MAEIRDQLVLEIDQALRSIDEVGRELQEASRVELNVGADQIQQASAAARELRVELSRAALEASNAGTPARDVAEALEIGRRESIGFAEALGRVQENAREAADELAETERQLRRAAENADRLALETARTAIEAGSAEANFEQLARALDVSEEEARRLSSQILDGAASAARLDREATDVAQALGLSEDQARQFVNELRRAPRELNDIDNRVDRINSGLIRFRTLVIGAVAAFGVRGLVQGANAAIDSFNALNESVNAVNVVFEEGADIVFDFGEKAARSAGLARGQFQQLVVPIGSLLRNFGFDANQAAEAATVLTQRAADLASVFNADVTEALTAIQAALRGETDPIERFGGSISAARVEALALAEGLAATKSEITDLDKVQARYLLILQDTARVQGDFARTVGDPANAARVLAAAVEEARAAIGASLIPALQELLVASPELIQRLEDIGPAIGGIASAAVETLPEVISFVDEILNQFDRLTIGLQLDPVRDDLNALAGEGRDLADVLEAIFLTPLDQQFTALFETSADVEAEFSKIVDVVRDLDEALDEGAPALDSLAQALGDVGRESIITASLLGVLQDRVGLTDQEFERFLTRFLQSSQAIGLSAEEFAILGFEVERLRDSLAFGGDPGFFDPRNFQLPDQSIQQGIVTLRELQTVADEVGVSIAEALGSDLFPAGTVFDVFAETEAQVAGFRDRLNKIGSEIDPLKGAVDALEISRAEFIANLTEAFEQEAVFEANLTRLGERGFVALEDALRELGPGANALVEEFLANAADAAVAEDVLAPTANRFATDLADQLRAEFQGSLFTGLPAELARSLAVGFERDPGTGFDLLAEKQARAINQSLRAGGALSELEDAGGNTGEEVLDSFAERVEELAPQIGFDAAIDLARALTSGPAAEEAAAAGAEIARLVNQAFQDNVSFDFDLRIPTPTFQPTSAPTTTPPAGPTAAQLQGGVIVNQEINTTPEREEADVARSTQLAGAVARNIR